MKKFLSMILSAALVVTMCPMAFAANDLNNHWAKQYISYLNEQEIMKPSADGNFKPSQTVSRAEFMRYINRAFGFTEKADIAFADVAAKDSTGATPWYYEPVQVAVAHGYINGVGNNKMDPFGLITREQAATIIGRLHKSTPTGNAASITFKDKAQISAWSVDYIAEAVEAGYLAGYPDGNFKPKGTITRAEFAKILYNYMGTSLRKPGGTYTATDIKSDVKNVSITSGATLSNADIKGDLYITEGVMNEAVTLQNVTVAGKIIVSGGALTISGVTASNMVVSTPLQLQPGITATGTTNIGMTNVQTSCTLDEHSLDVSAGGLADMKITGDKNPSIALNALLWNVTAEGPATISTSTATAINGLTAKAPVKVTGAGSVQKAVLQVSDCSLSMEPTSLELASGVTATIAGVNTAASNSVTISPSTFSFDIGSASKLDFYTDFTMNGKSDKVTKITCNDKTLVENTDYRLTNDGFRLYQKFLASLREGTHPLVVTFQDGTRGSLGITVTDSSKNYVDITTATFNKYHDSLDYANLTATLQLAKGVTLSSVKIGGTTLDRGSDYTYNATTGTVILQRTMLEKKSTGSYTATFVVSAGNNPTMALNIEDASPRNQLKPTSIDFDANSSSGGYQDITVELNPVDGATLKNIKCGDKLMQSGWQYRMSGNSVTLSKDALGDLARDKPATADLLFVMSKGENPTLRVNFVTTYPIKVTVADDLGEPVQGVEVTLAPTGDSVTDGSTPAQTLSTSTEGVATFYVKRGSYAATVKNDRFEQSLTRSFNVSSAQSVTLTAAIMENANIYVTTTTGANLADATVALGGQTVTTGKDGLASFKVKRGSYTLRVSCAGYKTTSETLVVNQTMTKRVTMQK